MTQTSKSPEQSAVEMTEMILPQHTNALGTVFGGVILSWIDIAAAICSQRHSEKSVVTASIDAVHFVAPIKLGWIVNIKASVNYTSRTSCEVGIRISSENPMTREFNHTASAYVTMVALDSNGKPTSIPQIAPKTPDQIRRQKAACERRSLRLQLKENIISKGKGTASENIKL